jgi:uracil-DNA glycosylase
MNGDLRNQWLLQQKDLYGNSLYLEEKENNSLYELTNLDDLKNQIRNCQNCSLSLNRKNVVFGIGNPDADLVFISLSPGENEDLMAEPFVGDEGKLLDNILNAINLNRKNIYLLNILKCKLPHNKTSIQNEIEQCEPYLKTQLNLINPKLIIVLGEIGGQTLLRIKSSLEEMRKNTYQYNGIDLIVTYHPQNLIKNVKLKRPVWEDFKKMRKKYLKEDKF